MSYCRAIVIGIIFGCVSELILATPQPPSGSPDERCSPCRCTPQLASSNDIESLTCDDGITAESIQKVIKNLKSNSDKQIYIKILSNELEEIPQKYLGDASVTGLTFEAPKLKSVHENAFVGQENSLQILVFAGCSLPSFPVKSMSKLNNLTRLWLKDPEVKFEHITKDMFTGFTKAAQISKFMLDNVGIKTIGSGAFSSFASLAHLYLNNNELEELKSDTLPEHKLSLLNLGGNNFNQFPVKLLLKISKEGNLVLDSNNIASVPPVAFDVILQNGFHVNVYENNVECGCAFEALAEYNSQHSIQNKVHGKCFSPEGLKGKEFHSLQVSDFQNCPDDEDYCEDYD